MSEHELVSGVARLTSLGTDDARHVLTVVVAAEDTCLSIFEASSPVAVERVNRQAGVALDRIVEATVFGPSVVPAGEGEFH